MHGGPEDNDVKFTILGIVGPDWKDLAVGSLAVIRLRSRFFYPSFFELISQYASFSKTFCLP